MTDINLARWCPHGRRLDIYCAQCEAERAVLATLPPTPQPKPQTDAGKQGKKR